MILPHSKRDLREETVIKSRLKSYFKKSYDKKKSEQWWWRFWSSLWVLFGILLMSMSGYVTYLTSSFTNNFWRLKDGEGVLFNVLNAVFQPAGWFVMWTGLDLLILKGRERLPELKFLKKMSKVHIEFAGYADDSANNIQLIKTPQELSRVSFATEDEEPKNNTRKRSTTNGSRPSISLNERHSLWFFFQFWA